LKRKDDIVGTNLIAVTSHRDGDIPEPLSKLVSSFAGFRNVGAPADLGDLTDQEIPFTHDLCRAILEYVYTAP
jgi:hypothetical protein